MVQKKQSNKSRISRVETSSKSPGPVPPPQPWGRYAIEQGSRRCRNLRLPITISWSAWRGAGLPAACSRAGSATRSWCWKRRRHWEARPFKAATGTGYPTMRHAQGRHSGRQAALPALRGAIEPPQYFDLNHPRYGLSEWEYRCARPFTTARRWAPSCCRRKARCRIARSPVPDYFAEMETIGATAGFSFPRTARPHVRRRAGGNRTLSTACRRDGVTIRIGHRVQKVIRNDTARSSELRPER